MMMDRAGTLDFILERYHLDISGSLPLNIPMSRHRGLPELLKDLGYTIGLEVGVETGQYSEQLCKAIPKLKLYSVDAWTAYQGYRDYVSQEELDGFYATATERLAPYGATLIKGWSVETAKTFADASLDFVYIDGNHTFEYVAADIAAWWPKVRPGGILAGHDFRRSNAGNCHVKDVVQAWAYSHHIKPWFVISHDKSPSWMWVC